MSPANVPPTVPGAGGEHVPLDNRPTSIVCGRCDTLFVAGGGRISVERFPGDMSPPEAGTNGLCEGCYVDAVDRLMVFLGGSDA